MPMVRSLNGTISGRTHQVFCVIGA